MKYCLICGKESKDTEIYVCEKHFVIAVKTLENLEKEDKTLKGILEQVFYRIKELNDYRNNVQVMVNDLSRKIYDFQEYIGLKLTKIQQNKILKDDLEKKEKEIIEKISKKFERFNMSDSMILKAYNFMKMLSINFYKIYNFEFSLPHITLNDSINEIDLEWNNKDFQLLISIPRFDDLSGLYGDNYDKDSIEMDFDEKLINIDLIMWLKRNIMRKI